MFDVKAKIIIVDMLLYIFGILVWFNGNFADALGLHGTSRFFAGLFSIIIGFAVTVIIVKSG